MADLRRLLETEDVDLLRGMVVVFAEKVMSADADAVCGVPWGGVQYRPANGRCCSFVCGIRFQPRHQGEVRCFNRSVVRGPRSGRPPVGGEVFRSGR